MIDSITCPHCHLVQFLTVDKKCRRCRGALIPIAVPAEPEPLKQTPFFKDRPTFIPSEVGPHLKATYEYWLPIVMLWQRLKGERSQAQIARSLGSYARRTWLSRMENGEITPTPTSLAHISQALGVPMSRLLKMCEYLMTGVA